MASDEMTVTDAETACWRAVRHYAEGGAYSAAPHLREEARRAYRDAIRAYGDARAAAAEARGVEKERANTEALADYIIGWCSAVDEDASWDGWDSWYKDAAWPIGTTPFDVLMREHYRRVADADSPHATYAEQQLAAMHRTTPPATGATGRARTSNVVTRPETGWTVETVPADGAEFVYRSDTYAPGQWLGVKRVLTRETALPWFREAGVVEYRVLPATEGRDG